LRVHRIFSQAGLQSSRIIFLCRCIISGDMDGIFSRIISRWSSGDLLTRAWWSHMAFWSIMPVSPGGSPRIAPG